MKWNNGTSFCILSNYPCIGCAAPTFPTNPLEVAKVSSRVIKLRLRKG